MNNCLGFISTAILAATCAGCCDNVIVLPDTAGLMCGPNCCDDNGSVEGKPDTCAIGDSPKCIGCDYEPVLCWTVCQDSFDGKCCLNDLGITVACIPATPTPPDQLPDTSSGG